MTIRSTLLVAGALAAGIIGLQTSTASAMPGLKVATAVATEGVAQVDKVRYICGYGGCVHTWGYRPYRAYGYGYGYGYGHPYRYGYYAPRVRLGFY